MKMAVNCPQCGAPVDASATTCKFCGEALTPSFQPMNQNMGQPMMNQNMGQPNMSVGGQPINIVVNTPMQNTPMMQNPAINPTWPIKSKVAAGLLAIFLGGLGIHKFYLGKVGMGILYLVFCWTYIPGILGVIEGIIYLCSNDENFQLKNHVRLQ
jgi:TM2 domain-containing membrane protein YozV